ncbi:MAG: hypothetical protein R3C58_00595 [Parvularculaceae bacterium]
MDALIIYAIILMVLGGGFTAWLGYRGEHASRNLKARMASRNHWLQMHALAKETDAIAPQADPERTEDEQD